jgi:hypothetical protein
MGAEQIKTRRDAEALLLERALREPAFRSTLIANPRGAIEQALGVKLPPEVRVTVLQETDRDLYLTLPPEPARELTDSELAAVAGGYGKVFGKAASRSKKAAEAAHNAESLNE